MTATPNSFPVNTPFQVVLDARLTRFELPVCVADVKLSWYVSDAACPS